MNNISDKICYLKEEWTCVPLCASYCELSNVTLTPIKQEVLVDQLLIDRLIRESKSSSGNNLDEIPSDYYKLAKRIIKTESTNNQLIENEKKMLINFGL